MAETLVGLLWVVLGGALGGAARFFVSGLVGRRVGETFPWGTMTVNVTGCFVIGVLAAGPALMQVPFAWQAGVTGFLGCYTTVSSFSLQTLALVRDGEATRAGGNVALTLVACLAAVALGYAAGGA